MPTSVTVDSQTTLYGVIGNPVRHSLSPLLHNAVFQKLKMNAVYLAFEVERDFLGLAFESARALGLRGLNVTIPFKETAINFVDEVP
ncbi:MAG: shikimate dehydrogenase, partial [Candidatus Omnitrophica bacterium]|nr:shikimate dehydrogenase [Candidatus Omnitrophota bacterium]